MVSGFHNALSFLTPRLMGLVILAMGLTATSAPAMADWRRVESNNFILFAEAKEDVALEFLSKLERYRRFLIEHGGVRPNLGGLKLTIYFTQSRRRYDALTGLKSSSGVFKLIQNGPIAVFFQPKKPHERVQARRGPYQDEEHQVVFHEYVHFLQFQAVPTQYPLWYREGFAEYLSSVVFRQDDTIVGKALYGRARNLHQFKWYDIKDILDADGFGDKAYMFYAQAWLLNHMLYTLPEFRSGISEFLDLLETNIDPAEALSKAYGIDYETLSARLREYFDSGQLYVIPYPAVSANLNVLSNQKLGKAESALVDKSIRLAFSRSSREFKSIAKSVNIQLKKRPRNTELAVTLIEALMGEEKWGAAQKVATELAEPLQTCKWLEHYWARLF